MPTDNDNGSGTPLGYASAPRPVSLQRAPAAPAVAMAAGQAPLETPEQIAARQARNAVISGGGNPAQSSYVAPGAITPVDYSQGQWGEQATRNRIDAGIASGNMLAGDYAYSPEVQERDPVHPNLSVGEAQAQRQRDFGLGTNNNAATNAMLGNAQATGDKYSAAFGNLAGSAGANAAAAGARGVDMYGGDLGQYGQGLANAQQSRGLQTGSYNALMGFANTPQGPSAAQAQLQQATDANTQNSLALARSGRGMGGGQAGLRQALTQNAGTQQQAANAAAELRANEYTAYQNQRLNALNAAGGLSSQIVGSDQAYGQLGLQGAQYQTDTALKGTQLNDASAQNWATQQGNAYAQGLGAEVGAQTQGLNINATALTGRENEYASANQAYATSQGLAQSASIADANRTQAYVGAGLSTAGTVLGALSDERSKMNIQPLGIPEPKPGTGSVQGAALPQLGPSQAEQDDQKRKATGQMIGKTGGSIAGSAVGSLAGPVGTVVGGAVGSAIGGTLGKVFSDVRSKQNIQPLSDAEPIRAPGGGLSSSGEYLRGNFGAGRRELDRDAFGARPLDGGNPFEQLVSQYGAGGVADSQKAVSQYQAASPKELGRFSRGDHPILSEGDALLADSARSIPGSTYEYKDPNEPGAKPGTQVGPMAQDLAANPLTRGTVIKTKGGKLGVDTPRLTLYNTAQQHGQQNQLDALNSKIASLESMLKRKPGDDASTNFRTSTGGL